MPKRARVLASDLSLAEIRRLLAAKEKMVALEEQKAQLAGELAAVRAALDELAVGAGPGAAAGGRARRKAVRKPAGKRGRKPARAGAKPPARKAARAERGQSGDGGTLQDVVAALIREQGKPMAFQEILGAITRRKLVRTRSGNFANVLRRTLYTSKRIKRVARATYGV